MPFNVLLLPLLGGFLFVTFWNRTKWYAVRAEKDRLVIYASLAGFSFLTIAWLITLIPFRITCREWFWCFPTWWEKNRPFEYAGTTSLAFALACVAFKVFNLYWTTRDKEADRILVNEGGPLEQIFDLAMHSKKRVLITLKDRKVYVGRIDSSFTPGQLARSIHLLPAFSGYRESDKKRVTLTTDYLKAYDEIRNRYPETHEEIIADFGVVVQIDDILTISLYRQNIHKEFFAPVAHVCPCCFPDIPVLGSPNTGSLPKVVVPPSPAELPADALHVSPSTPAGDD